MRLPPWDQSGLLPIDGMQILGPHQRNDRTEKTCQHSAMKHRRENKRAPHASASAVPSYHRILVKHGLIEKTLSISDAYEVFLKVALTRK